MLAEMYVNVVFVIRCLYSAVSECVCVCGGGGGGGLKNSAL